jgi:hypothetical protein
VAKTIKTFSENYGMYHYPKMVAADANDGMEYPMITMDGGRDPGYHGLLIHEIAHNWFYGMVGSNETYRAALDEGFTQFLTADGLIRIDGEKASGVNALQNLAWPKMFVPLMLILMMRLQATIISSIHIPMILIVHWAMVVVIGWYITKAQQCFIIFSMF